MFRFTGGIFNAVTRANLLVDAIENAVMGATHAVTGLLKYTIKVGEEYENTQLRIANTLTSMSLAPSVKTASEGALEIMSTLRTMAAKLPGEAKDYYNVFAAALPDAIAAGMTDIKKYTEFAGKYTAAAMSRMVDAPQAGRDLQEMLQGRAHLRTKTYQELRTYIGMSAKEFNKLAPEKRMSLLMDAVAKASGGMAMAAETANAKFGELKSRIEEIFAIGGQPFFEAVKTGVTEINQWLEKNKVAVMDLARSVATGLGDAFVGVLSTVKTIADKIAELKGEGTTTAAKTRSERLKELEAAYMERSTFESLTSFVPGVGLYYAMRDLGEIERLSKETEADYKKFLEQQATIQSRAGAAAQIKPKAYTPGILEQLAAETRLKELAPVKGVKSMFGTQAEWAAFVEARGYDPKALWDQLIKEGKVEMPKAPTSVRELKVEFNNNRFDIRQEFAEGFDPDRIAVAFASDLARAGEMKLGAVTAPTFSAH